MAYGPFPPHVVVPPDAARCLESLIATKRSAVGGLCFEKVIPI